MIPEVVLRVAAVLGVTDIEYIRFEKKCETIGDILEASWEIEVSDQEHWCGQRLITRSGGSLQKIILDLYQDRSISGQHGRKMRGDLFIWVAPSDWYDTLEDIQEAANDGVFWLEWWCCLFYKAGLFSQEAAAYLSAHQQLEASLQMNQNLAKLR